ncbi:MAG: chemotaxis protein CheV [Lachnospiraceae bacterium]|nr:chemotaxis protein CheV [Lachnospiraceae bacterium]
MDTNILLESGTNELEILEFTINDNSYGINVAKVKEIILYQPVTPVPNAHPSVEGIFMPRDTMITAIDLRNCLQLGSSEEKGLFIITNFNNLDMAFHVDAVKGIHRVAWTQVLPPDLTLSGADAGVSTGIVKIGEKLIIILDFEKIITDINPATGLKVEEVSHLANRARIDVPILIAEDSELLNKLISQSLKTAGYERLTHTENGQEAWDLLCKWRDDQTILEKAQLVITDIEMPQMDGHRLTKLIKTDEMLKDIPVVIFSSTINDETRRKGESVGADAQLTKPEIGQLVAALDKIVGISE